MSSVSTEVALQYASKGPCAAVGKEVWFLQGKLLKVGIITHVDEAKNTITVEAGGTTAERNAPVVLNPEDRIIMSKKPKSMK